MAGENRKTFAKATQAEFDGFQPYYQAFVVAHDGYRTAGNHIPFMIWIQRMRRRAYREGVVSHPERMLEPDEVGAFTVWLFRCAKCDPGCRDAKFMAEIQSKEHCDERQD